jgi:hypothetical protein
VLCPGFPRSKQKISLCHRQSHGGFAGQQHAVGAHFVGFGIDLDRWGRVVVDHAALADGAARVRDGTEHAVEAEPFADVSLQGRA